MNWISRKSHVVHRVSKINIEEKLCPTRRNNQELTKKLRKKKRTPSAKVIWFYSNYSFYSTYSFNKGLSRIAEYIVLSCLSLVWYTYKVDLFSLSTV